jgi:hypothetical protein
MRRPGVTVGPDPVAYRAALQTVKVLVGGGGAKP